MIRPLRLASLLAAAAVVLASCSSASEAATVNGNPITDDEVTGIRSSEVEAVVPGDEFRADLETLIAFEASLDAAETDFGITGLETQEAREEWLATATPDQVGVVTAIEENPDLAPAAADAVTTQLMLQEAVVTALIEDEGTLRGIWDTERGALTEVCARHIVVDTREEAAAAYDRVTGGEEFSLVADDVSLDTGSPGGQLICPSSPSQFVAEFASVLAAAPIGEVVEPFQTQFGWHVVIVDDRTAPASFEEFAADAESWLTEAQINAAFTAWRQNAIASADVVVRSQIGQWVSEGGTILPPPGSP